MKEWEEGMIAEGKEDLVIPKEILMRKKLVIRRQEKEKNKKIRQQESLKKKLDRLYKKSEFLTQSIEQLERGLRLNKNVNLDVL